MRRSRKRTKPIRKQPKYRAREDPPVPYSSLENTVLYNARQYQKDLGSDYKSYLNQLKRTIKSVYEDGRWYERPMDDGTLNMFVEYADRLYEVYKK